MNFLLILVTCGLVILVFNFLIRWSLRAPKVVEQSTPGELDLQYSEIEILTANGKKLFAWLIPAAGAENAPALAVLHGWGGNAGTMLPLARPLHRAGYTLLFFDARSHGRSDVDTFSSMPRFAEDLDHALNWLKSQPGVDPARVGVVGHSVGAAAAMLAASQRSDLAAVVSIAAFMHPKTVMRRLLAAWHVPYVPFGWYVLQYVQYVIGYRFDDIAPINTIGRLRCPLLLVHGSEDAMVPLAEVHALYARHGGARDRLLVVKGSHDSYGDLERQVGDLIAFLDEVMS
ncbi:MAG: alpha/beta fold hydrolase [Sulfuricella denitrificans]|nr:alpha/beta fold hydrolase [Sulfuricella denitrificans]